MSETTPNQNSSSPSSSIDRRRFIKGVATGSVLMTVASRPAMGAWCTPSAWVSGNLSQPGNERSTCGGKSPGYWQTQPTRWPSKYKPGTCATTGPGTCKSYNPNGTPFHQITNAAGLTGPFYGTTFNTLTMMQVLWLMGTGDPYQTGAHIVAALLNAATIPNYGMTEATVIEIWRQLAVQGYYQPSVGSPMYPQDVVNFIKNTF